MALPEPSIGHVTSQSHRDHLIAQVSETLVKLAAVWLGFSLILQLPWNWQPGSAFHLLLVAITGAVLRFLP